MEPERFLTHSLIASPFGGNISRILSAAIKSVNPYAVVSSNIVRENSYLEVNNQVYDLDSYKRIFVIAFGKASIPMIVAVKDVMGRFFNQGIAITKSTTSLLKSYSSISALQGTHPIPDETNIVNTKKVIDLLQTTSSNDLVIFLISGGGSALLTSPAKGIKLEDIQTLTKMLLKRGATINELNCIRKHLSQVKGGGLACMAAPSEVITLILSDVVGDRLDVIASGPTVPDPTTFLDAQSILNKFGILSDVPSAIKEHLSQGIQGLIPETPKQDDSIFGRVNNIIIGSNSLAADAAKHQALLEGLNASILSTTITGEARIVGHFLGSIVQQISKTEDLIHQPACIIAGGETTVTIKGNGLGGRNLEVALSTVKQLSKLQNKFLITLATDGDDGPTNAAGAVVTGTTLERAEKLGFDPEDYLERNDSYHFFEPLSDLIITGPTETNVCDLNFIFAFP